MVDTLLIASIVQTAVSFADAILKWTKTKKKNEINKLELNELARQFDIKVENEKKMIESQVTNLGLKNQLLELQIDKIKKSKSIRINNNLVIDFNNIQNIRRLYSDHTYPRTEYCEVYLLNPDNSQYKISTNKTQCDKLMNLFEEPETKDI